MTKRTGIIAAMALMLALTRGGSLLAATPPAAGTISIETKSADADFDPALPAFVDAVGQAFYDKGFTVLEDPGHSAFVVELSLDHADVGTGKAKVPHEGSSVEPGGAPNAVGVGVRIPLPTGKSTLVPLVRTRLDIRIRKRGEDTILWQGAAITVRAAGTRNGADTAVAAALSQALLRAYPAQPEDVIGVP